MPSILRKSLFVVALASAAALTSVSQAADEPSELIKYRKATMAAIGAHMGAIAMAVKGDVSFTDEIAVHASAINAMSQNLLRLFPAGTGPEAGNTEALATIWERPEEFAAAIKALQDESAQLAVVAETGDMAAIGPQTGKLGNEGCGNCHQTFRAKQN